MLEQLKTVMQLASVVTEIPRRKAEKIARNLSGLTDGAALGAGQVASLAEEIMKKSQQNAQMIQTLISSEIRRQVKSLGLVTRDDLDRVNRKVFGLATKEDIDRLSRKVDNQGSKSPAPSGATKVAKTATSASKPKAKAKPAAKPKGA